MTVDEVLQQLIAQENPANSAGMARFGIRPQTRVLGISVVNLRALAKTIKGKARNPESRAQRHALAMQLWDSGIHEARLLAAFIADPQALTAADLERMVAQLDSWDLCDQICDLFAATPYAYQKGVEWTARPQEFVKREGFVLLTTLAVHDKKAPDERFLEFLPLVKREATDPRNFVKKAVNWLLRQTGKRSRMLNAAAIACAEELRQMDDKTARWIAADALRELRSEKIQARLKR